MTALQLIFYAFSTVAICSGLMVVLSSNPVRGALFLVLTFFATAGLWMLLHAEFLALILVLVYVGAVMTLFLFVVMMLNVKTLKLREGFVSYLPLCLLITIAIVALIGMVLGPQRFGLNYVPMPLSHGAAYSNIDALGSVLYTDYAYPFEIAGILLLTAIIATITLTYRPVHKRKTQVISEQIAVRREDRVRLIKMPSAIKQKPSGEKPS